MLIIISMDVYFIICKIWIVGMERMEVNKQQA